MLLSNGDRSNVTVDVIISRRLFLFGQLRSKVSAGFTNVSSLAVAAFDLVYCSQSVLRFAFVLNIRKSSSLSGYRFVCNKYIVKL